MSQATFDDDDLFGEAAEEMRAEVEEHLAAAREALPAPEAVWETDADNVLGVLNGLKTALDAGDASDELRQAKKSYVVGERADAFEDAEDLAGEIEELEELLETLETAAENVGELASTVPALRGDLDDAREAADGSATETDGGGDDVEADAENGDDADDESDAGDEIDAEAEEAAAE